MSSVKPPHYNKLKDLYIERGWFKDLRPFSGAYAIGTEKELLGHAQEQLEAGQIEIPTLINTEFGFYQRNKKATVKLAELFAEFNLKPIAWLHAARKELKKIKLDTTKSGDYTVYNILLSYPKHLRRSKDRHGIYIGQTSKTALERYLRHKNQRDQNDFISRPQPRRYGTEILYSLTPHLPEKGLDEDYSKYLEKHQVAKRLKKPKFKTKGLPLNNVKGGH